MHYTGTITFDGAPPPLGWRLNIMRDDLHSIDHSLAIMAGGVLNPDGSYNVRGDIGLRRPFSSITHTPEDCDRIWLIVGIPGFGDVYSHYLSDGCGEHTLNIDITRNIQITGTATLDGGPFASGLVYVFVRQMPPDLETRRVRVTIADAAGHYTFNTWCFEGCGRLAGMGPCATPALLFDKPLPNEMPVQDLGRGQGPVGV